MPKSTRRVKKTMQTALHAASRTDHHSVVKLLIENGASLNEKDIDENTPAHLACQKGDLVTLEVLVDSGADLHAKNKKGWTPLHEAMAKGGNNHKVIQYLVDVLGRDCWMRLRLRHDPKGKLPGIESRPSWYKPSEHFSKCK